MTLEDGKSIVCTMEHKILTGKGWKPLGDISTGEYVLVNGRAISTAPTTYQNKEWLESRFKEGKRPKELAVEAGVSTEAIKKWAYHHELSWDKTNWNRGAKYTINISQEERERRRNHAREINKTLPRPKGKNHPSWKEELSLETRAYNWLKYARPSILEKADYKCQNCGSPHNRLHCHHIKPVKTHPELGCEESNIVVLCPACHKQAHSLSAHPVKVISIEAIGEVETYDIAMNAPHHNFVANGVVVHNSMRYTGQRIVQCANGILPVEEVFYLRPEGYYTDRKGHKYHYTEHQRNKDLDICMQGALRYAELINAGYAEEHARGILPFDYRQHFVLSLNMRSLGHLLTIRGKRDAQLEIQQMCQLMLPHFQTWAPEIYSWFEAKQWQKGRLAL
jgi:thymidylate synthase (FAD)